MALFLKGQSPISEKMIYEDFGTWSLDVNNDKVSISAFATIELLSEPIQEYELELQMQQKKRKEVIETTKTIRRYELYLKSNSVFNGDTTSTWIYGGRVFINGVEVTGEQFPNGFTILIEKEPTLVYWHETTSLEKINFYVNWQNAIYENRLHN
jgi:hypothetical protein